EAEFRAGAATEALRRLEATDREAIARGQWVWRPGILRAKAAALAAEGDDAAEACLRESIAVARDQHARSAELRAATSLAELLGRKGRRGEARDLLAPIYGWFTEGLDTPDLKDAADALASLA
ncbi:MAG TPA: hypothetical protein VKU84_06470, partial [Stellaceae bacterium]|nr:hypothetical protein [Stellaceae bacterium]